MRRLVFPAAMACVLVAPPTFADDVDLAATDAAAGRVLFAEGSYTGALMKLQTAYAESKDPRLLFEIGRCERSLKRPAEAMRYFVRYRTLALEGRAEVDGAIASVRPFVAPLEVTTDPPGADIAVDGRPIGAAPIAAYWVDRGVHRVVATKDGWQERAETIDVTGSGDVALDLRLGRRPGGAEPASPALSTWSWLGLGAGALLFGAVGALFAFSGS